MATINIGPYTATVTNNGNSFSGTLELIVYKAGGVDIIRISAANNPNGGAQVQGSYSPWSASITGELVMLGGLYEQSFHAAASQTGFDVPLPKESIGVAEISGRVKLEGDTLTVTVDADIGVPFEYMGVSLTPVCNYREVTTIAVGTQSMSKSFSVEASVLGVEVSASSPSITVDASTVVSIASRVHSALLAKIWDIIENYLFAWANALADMGASVAGYIADFGDQIVAAFESLFGGGSSSGPPPPFLINTFSGSAQLGNAGMIEFGQALSTSDGDQSFAFPQAFGGTCRAVLLNTARPNIWSGLSVGSRSSSNFIINRDNAIDYHVPFHWLAFGPAPGTSLSESGYTDVGDVRIQWGRGTSSSDGDQTFNSTSGFGSGPVAVVVNTDEAGIRSALALASIDAAAGHFVVNRDNAVDGSVSFTYLAIGPAPGRSLSQGLLRHGGLIMQWGQANSSTDGEQLIQFPVSFESMNFGVFTSFVQANVQSALSLSRAINEAGFIVNRDAQIDGVVPFNWIAVGW